LTHIVRFHLLILKGCSASWRYRHAVAPRNASYTRGQNVTGPGSLRGRMNEMQMQVVDQTV